MVESNGCLRDRQELAAQEELTNARFYNLKSSWCSHLEKRHPGQVRITLYEKCRLG